MPAPPDKRVWTKLLNTALPSVKMGMKLQLLESILWITGSLMFIILLYSSKQSGLSISPLVYSTSDKDANWSSRKCIYHGHGRKQCNETSYVRHCRLCCNKDILIKSKPPRHSVMSKCTHRHSSSNYPCCIHVNLPICLSSCYKSGLVKGSERLLVSWISNSCAMHLPLV